VVQREQGKLSEADITSLNMTSGYTSFRYPRCARLRGGDKSNVSVKQCFDAKNISGSNAGFDEDAVGRFYYGGGHFQKQAIDLGLGGANNISLQREMQTQLGSDFIFGFDSPQLAGGVATSAADYAVFLRKILDGQLLMHDALGTHPVCTNPSTCSSAMYAPIPSKESWHYSLGHWVEDDPQVGDAAFSSPGAFGFYPWIDHSKSYYGIVARKAGVGGAIDSVKCGRKIRRAWMTGMEQ
jgi:CubicO group peptidase (beta-lactamase class C family)